jgi:hypothetical protein
MRNPARGSLTSDDARDEAPEVTADVMRDVSESRLLHAIACVMTKQGPGQFVRKARAKRHEEERDYSAFERLCEALGQAAQDPTDPVAFRPERPVSAFKPLPGQPPASRRRRVTQSRSSKQS